MEEPQQAAPGMVFSARAGLGNTSYRNWCKQGQFRTESEGIGRGETEEILTEVAVLSTQRRKFRLWKKADFVTNLSLDDHAEDKQLHAFLVLDNTHSFPKICCQI